MPKNNPFLFFTAFIASVTLHSILLLKSSQTSSKKMKFFHSGASKVKLKFDKIGDDASKELALGFEEPKKFRKKRLQKKKSKAVSKKKLVERINLNGRRTQNWAQEAINHSSINQEFSKLNPQFEFVIPKGIPREKVPEIKSQLYSFNLRLRKQFHSSVISTYYEMQRMDPRFDIPINRREDIIIIKATYNEKGNVIRIKTLLAPKEQIYSDFFQKAIESIETIPNPPEILLNNKREFSQIYSLGIN